jgi:dienelactone hydrolase
MKKILFLIMAFVPLTSTAFFEVELVYHLYKVDNPAPTIIVGHDCSGADGHSDEWARQLNKWGFNAVNLDSFGPRKITDECKLSRFPGWKRTDETYRLAELIKKQPWHKGKIGYIGFSHGASTAVYLSGDSGNKNIDAAVAYYPWCRAWGGREIFSGAPKINLMMALGKRDDWTPYIDCMGTHKNLEIHLYENATHAFDQRFPGWSSRFLNYYLEHDTQANIDSRVAARIFFRKYLQGILEDDAVAREEFIKPIDSKPFVVHSESYKNLLPELAEPTEEDVDLQDKNLKRKNKVR